MSMPMGVAVSNASDIGSAVESLRWISVLRVVGAALVALGVGLELLGEVLGHPSEQALRQAREAEIAGLTAQVEALRRIASTPPAVCEVASAAPGRSEPKQACPLPED